MEARILAPCPNEKGNFTKITMYAKAYSPTYISWVGMNRRCRDKKHNSFKNYGGRGISVCKEWKENYQAFLNDMGVRPEGKTLDRINNDDGYYKENCRWSTKSEQGFNTRWTRFIEFHGIKKTVVERSIELGGKSDTVRSRLNRGWSIDRAFNTPVRKYAR